MTASLPPPLTILSHSDLYCRAVVELTHVMNMVEKNVVRPTGCRCACRSQRGATDIRVYVSTSLKLSRDTQNSGEEAGGRSKEEPACAHPHLACSAQVREAHPRDVEQVRIWEGAEMSWDNESAGTANQSQIHPACLLLVSVCVGSGRHGKQRSRNGIRCRNTSCKLLRLRYQRPSRRPLVAEKLRQLESFLPPERRPRK